MPKFQKKWFLHWDVGSPDKQGRGWWGGWMQAAPGRGRDSLANQTHLLAPPTPVLIPNNPMTLIIFIIWWKQQMWPHGHTWPPSCLFLLTSIASRHRPHNSYQCAPALTLLTILVTQIGLLHNTSCCPANVQSKALLCGPAFLGSS